MKKQTILLSALALTMLASCEKEVVTAPAETKKAQITMQLGQYGETKGIGAFTPDGAQVAVGTSFNVESFDATPASLENVKMEFTRTGTTNVYTATADVNAAATKLKLTGNYDGTVVNTVTLTPNVNTRQGDVNSPVVQISGEGAITGSEGAKVANVSVSPEMARIEIVGANDGGNLTMIKDVKIKAIYLNNVKLNRTDAGLSISKGGVAFGNDYKDGGIKAKLCDKNTTGWQIVGADGTRKVDAFGVGQAVGYNMFPQPGGADTDLHPHVSIDISYFKKTDGVNFDVTPTVGFLNIRAFKKATSYIDSFVAGSVYAFSVTDITDLINDPETPITPEPEPEVGNVTITCTVKEWTVVPVTPEV